MRRVAVTSKTSEPMKGEQLIWYTLLPRNLPVSQRWLPEMLLDGRNINRCPNALHSLVSRGQSTTVLSTIRKHAATRGSQTTHHADRRMSGQSSAPRHGVAPARELLVLCRPGSTSRCQRRPALVSRRRMRAPDVRLAQRRPQASRRLCRRRLWRRRQPSRPRAGSSREGGARLGTPLQGPPAASAAVADVPVRAARLVGSVVPCGERAGAADGERLRLAWHRRRESFAGQCCVRVGRLPRGQRGDQAVREIEEGVIDAGECQRHLRAVAAPAKQ